MVGKYHVVCHECPEEGILDDRDAARTMRAEHEAATGHRVTSLEIEPPVANA